MKVLAKCKLQYHRISECAWSLELCAEGLCMKEEEPSSLAEDALLLLAGL